MASAAVVGADAGVAVGTVASAVTEEAMPAAAMVVVRAEVEQVAATEGADTTAWVADVQGPAAACAVAGRGEIQAAVWAAVRTRGMRSPLLPMHHRATHPGCT